MYPVETIWSKIKAVLKQRMRVPQVQPPRVGEQWLAYVQELIDESMGLITYLYYNISRTIQLISVVLLWLFCYRLYVWFLLHCGIDM